jgi:hypothetical protein
MSNGMQSPNGKQHRARKRHKPNAKSNRDRGRQGSALLRAITRPSAAGMGMKIALRLVGPIVFLVSFVAVVKLFVNTTLGERFVAGTACAAVIYELFDFINWKRALLLREKRLRPLLGKYVLWFFSMVAVAVVGFVVDTGSWEGLLVVLAFVLIAFMRARLEEGICERSEELGVQTPQPIWGKHFARWVDALTREQAKLKVDDTTPLLDVSKRRFARWLRARRISPHHDGRRVVSVIVIAAALLFGAWHVIAWAKRNAHELKTVISLIEPSHRSGKSKPPRSVGVSRSTAPASQSPLFGSAATVPETSISTGSIDECATPLVTGGPLWVEEDIAHLYLGGAGAAAAEAPGTAIAGCPGELHLTRTASGMFAYTEGRSPTGGQSRSVAVDSRRFDAALFLAPAVKPVMALIERFKILGGLHRYTVADGDFYPVQTPVGTYILIRRETGTEQTANPYLVVPPTVAQAWSLAISRSAGFLWPRSRHEGGKEIYDFYTNASPSRVAYSFSYQPSDMPEPELSEAELQADANLAG